VTANLWQVVGCGLDGVTRHGTYTSQREAERAAADLANQLDDNDPTEYYAEPADGPDSGN
jgi:hypothetical protein